MRATLLAIAVVISFYIAAEAIEAQGRIDIDGSGDGIVLSPGNAEGGNVSNMGWVEEPKRSQTLFAVFPAANEWRTGSFSFTPDRDGSITLFLKAAWDKDNVSWTLYDEIKVEGGEIVNGSFENGMDGWQFNDKEQKPAISSDAKDGSKSIKAAHNYPAFQIIKVKAKQPVKIAFSYKSAE